MSLLKLRDYQERAMTLMRKAARDGKKKIMLFMATGGGKGVIYLHLVRNSLKNKKKVLLIMRRRQLVLQTQRRFTESGITSSIIMASEKGFDPECDFQVCSIDTISRRDPEFFKKFNFVIVDEAHDCTSPTYQNFFKTFNDNTIFIGLTATPFPNGNKTHDFWEACVKPIEMDELKNLGYLVPCALYVPHEIDLSSVSINKTTKDYDSKELGEKMSKLEVIGNIVDDYLKIGQGKPAICFCVNKDHSMTLCLEFNNRGIPSAHADESTPQKERDQIISDFRQGKIKVIFNINIFSTGVDIPEIEVAIMARPTRSEILWVQQVGRAFRPYRKCGKCHSQYDNSPSCPKCGWDKPSYIKTEAIIIDSGNNCSRLGHPFDVRYPSMKKSELKSREITKSLTKICKFCAYTYDARIAKCPKCDGAMDLPKELFTTKKGEIVPYDEFSAISNHFNSLRTAEIVKNWKPNSKYFKLYEKFGDRCMVFEKEFNIPRWVPTVVKKNKEKELKGKLYV